MTNMKKLCNHKTYNSDCSVCLYMMNHCDMAEKHGYISFDECYDGHGQLTVGGWDFMKKYFRESLETEPDEHEVEDRGDDSGRYEVEFDDDMPDRDQ